MITGSPDKTLQTYVAETYLHGGSPLRGLSLGCGGGANEILWARTGRFSSIDAYDRSEQRIRVAIASMRNTPEEGLIHYRVGNIGLLALPETSYDVVIFEHSLHHLTPLDRVLPRIKSFLRPGGFLVANEFFGPTRFQWSDRQLSVVNALLRLFPSKYTLLHQSQLPKLKSIRPSKLSTRLSDPSEAVESSNIIPMLREYFRVVKVNGYGGTVLHLLFSGIGHHFVHPDPVAERLLNLSFEVEDILLKSGELPHDFALVDCQK
jgi:ubiquinone/menaquinone biosynthesis C-methylase UbiE